MTSIKKQPILPFTLPEKPVDKFRIHYFRVWRGGADNIIIDEITSVYHINTSWDAYSPNNRGGADLVDDWMVFENGSATGRIEGWVKILEIDPEAIFETKTEAIKYAIEVYGKWIADAKERIRKLEQLRLNLEAKI